MIMKTNSISANYTTVLRQQNSKQLSSNHIVSADHQSFRSWIKNVQIIRLFKVMPLEEASVNLTVNVKGLLSELMLSYVISSRQIQQSATDWRLITAYNDTSRTLLDYKLSLRPDTGDYKYCLWANKYISTSSDAFSNRYGSISHNSSDALPM